MKPDYARWFAECLSLTTEPNPPSPTRRERLEHAQLIAREYARREARMAPQPQLALGEVA